MKLLAFSDLHCDLPQAHELTQKSADVDVVIGAGDFASVHRELEETLAVLSAIDKPTVLVPGNNETEDELREACAGWSTARVLHGEGCEIEGVSFYGLGGGVPPTPWDWSFDLTEQEAANKLAGCPEGCVLIVHSPPRGHVDGQGEAHLGSAAILETIEAKKPRLTVCGHVHECWGEESRIGETRVLNLGPAGVSIDL